MKNQIAPPISLEGTNALVQVCVRYDDVCIKSNQLLAPIDVPDCPVDPLVSVQRMDNSHTPHGTIWVYDWAKEVFVEYHESQLDIPKSKKDAPKKDAPKKDAPKKSKKAKPSAPAVVKHSPPRLDMSAKSKVEFDSQVHAEDPPIEDADKTEHGASEA